MNVDVDMAEAVVEAAVEGGVDMQGPAGMTIEVRGLPRKGLIAAWARSRSGESAVMKGAVGKVLKGFKNSWTWLRQTDTLKRPG